MLWSPAETDGLPFKGWLKMMKKVALAKWLGKPCEHEDSDDMKKPGMTGHRSRNRAVFKAMMGLTCSVNLNEFNRQCD